MIALLKEFNYDAIEFLGTGRDLCFELIWVCRVWWKSFARIGLKVFNK